jgi:CRP-like cAMP-binding protein
MFFIEAGRVRVDRASGAKTVAIAELAAGDLFGEMALLTGNPRSATVAALTNVDLWALSQSDFDDLVTTYPNLALALSRLLSERLRSTDQLFLQGDLPAATPIAPAEAAMPVSAVAEPSATPKPKRKRPARKRRRNLTKQLTNTFDDAVLWFGELSNGAKVRLVLVTLLLAWMLCIAAPMLVISTLAADDVTNLQGAIAFVHITTPDVPAVVVNTQEAATTEESVVVQEPPAVPNEAPAPPAGAELLGSGAAGSVAAEPSQPAPAPTEAQPTPTPWIIVVTNTPAPATDTPIPPTATPIPPTPTPKPVQSAAKPLVVQPTNTPVPVEKQQPPRSLDPRLGSLGVVVQPAGVKPGQSYWRLIEARWQNESESGGDHTIYVNLVDENGGRITGHPIEIAWAGGSLTLTTEDKPKPEYSSNFPMYNTLGSYAVKVPGLPSDIIVGLGLGTADQPAFTVHTNFFLTFQRVTR